MKQLSGPDAMYLYTEMDGFPMHIGGVSIFDQRDVPGGGVKFRQILDMFASRLDRSPIFRRKLAEVPLTLDRPYWIDDDNFDLEFHVRHIALPQPGDWRQLCIQVARLHARPLDRGRPLWEVYVIEGLNGVEGVRPGSFAMYTKVHHCAIDGHSGMQFFGAFSDRSPKPPRPEPPAPWAARRPPSAARLLRRAYWNNLGTPARLVSLGRRMLHSRDRVKQGLEHGDFRKPGEIPSTRINGRLSPHRVVDAARFDFDGIKTMRRAVPGATVNDVVLAIVSGALRRYLLDKGELPDESLVSGCPVNLRDENELEAEEGNVVGIMSVALCTGEARPLERLKRVHEEAESSKALLQARGARLNLDFLDTVPSGIQSLLVHASTLSGMAERHPMMNAMVSNVPGSPCQLYMCGARIVDSFGLGPLSPGLGLFHTVNTSVMNDQRVMTLSFVSCRDAMPDPAFYTGCLYDAFEELREACVPVVKKKPGAKQKSTTAQKSAAKRKKPVANRKSPASRKKAGQRQSARKTVGR